ncbi:Metallo-dependent phosphatase-like protein, partial [Circinella umbellata]
MIIYLAFLTLFFAHVYSFPLSSSLTKREQPDAPPTPKIDLNPLEWGDLNFIHTTDIHGWLEGHTHEGSYNGDLGDLYSFIIRMKEKARSLKKDLFVVDTGDTHDGNGLSDVTTPHGRISQPILTHIPYDLLTVGNHELYLNDVIEHTYREYVPHWNKRYLASNVYFKDLHSGKTVPFGEKYTYFEGEFGTTILAFGFLFDFKGNGNMSVVQKAEDEIQQPWFKEALSSHNPDVVVLIGHAGLRLPDLNVVRKAIREHYPYKPIAVLGGHLHIRDFALYDEWSAGIASGRFMETVGFFSIQGVQKQNQHKKLINQRKIENEYPSNPPPGLVFKRRYLDQNRASYIFHSIDNGDVSNFDTTLGEDITKNITEWRNKLGILKAIGCAPQTYYRNDVPVNDSASIYKLTIDEVLPLAVTDYNRPVPPYFIFDTGTTRFDIYKGYFTLDNVEQVSPFINSMQYIANIPVDLAPKILEEANKADFGDGHKKRSYYSINNFTPFSCDDQESQSFVDRRAIQTPGHTTIDDLGTDGKVLVYWITLNNDALVYYCNSISQVLIMFYKKNVC